MNFFQDARFINEKHFTNFLKATDRNDGLIASSKFQRNVKRWRRHISVKIDGIESNPVSMGGKVPALKITIASEACEIF